MSWMERFGTGLWRAIFGRQTIVEICRDSIAGIDQGARRVVMADDLMPIVTPTGFEWQVYAVSAVSGPEANHRINGQVPASPPPLPPKVTVYETPKPMLAAPLPPVPAPIKTIVPVPTSAEIVQLRAASNEQFLFASRLASIQALNPPKAIARRRPSRPLGSKPMPLRAHAAKVGQAKSLSRIQGPRVLRPMRHEATIIRFDARRQSQDATAAA